ncbi:MAG TPA: ABC transporter permease [Candidatus Limnocylindria bacterium]|nr:ABC transporter permease [Candidatus Limnocylindria bacterium]
MTAAAAGIGAARALPGWVESTVDFLRLLSRRPVGLLGLAGIVFFILFALVVPVFVPVLDATDVTAVYQGPSAAHPLGTDYAGRDVLNQLVHGGREILVTAALTGFLSTLTAVALGAIAATVGGKVDAVIVAVNDVVLTIPHFPVLVVAAALLRPDGVVVLALLLAALTWSALLRQIRAQVLSLRERDYIEAARALDLGLPHIVFREILPNMRSYIVIHFILGVTAAIYLIVGLVVLGLVPLSGKNWAITIYFAVNQGALYFRDSFLSIASPIAMIVLFQLSLVFFVSALEDIFDPRLRRS